VSPIGCGLFQCRIDQLCSAADNYRQEALGIETVLNYYRHAYLSLPIHVPVVSKNVFNDILSPTLLLRPGIT
jgi:hypothetical protein